ncbi:MAG: hypothetical protein WC592_02595 [Candidatus Omnitrophota bacterium]
MGYLIGFYHNAWGLVPFALVASLVLFLFRRCGFIKYFSVLWLVLIGYEYSQVYGGNVYGAMIQSGMARTYSKVVGYLVGYLYFSIVASVPFIFMDVIKSKLAKKLYLLMFVIFMWVTPFICEFIGDIAKR